jgi:uncharacterized protein (UPF0548 family)
LLCRARPREEWIRSQLNRLAGEPFSYSALEATRAGPQGCADLVGRDYTVDHRRALLGYGGETFRRARAALLSWRMFSLDWVELCWPALPVQVGTTVGVLARIPLGWSFNACRVVYRLEEAGEVERSGFAYGTVPEHAASGEERFSVEWNRADDSVWYDLLAFSRPHQLPARLGRPYVRVLQKRFARDSTAAMAAAVES